MLSLAACKPRDYNSGDTASKTEDSSESLYRTIIENASKCLRTNYSESKSPEKCRLEVRSIGSHLSEARGSLSAQNEPENNFRLVCILNSNCEMYLIHQSKTNRIITSTFGGLGCSDKPDTNGIIPVLPANQHSHLN